jgi:ribonucleotide reductase beta subunit family protein with ferritin-like domain
MVHNAVSDLTLGALGASGDRLVRYGTALRRACEDNPPPYGQAWFGRQFRQYCKDATRFARLLASDAHMEGYSAGRIWEFAESVEDPALSAALFTHAADEARHSRVFGHLLTTLFPAGASDDVRRTLAGFAPRLSLHDRRAAPARDAPTDDELLSSVIMINLYETKALVLERLLHPVLLAYATDATRPKVESAILAILRDEVAHIRYTAEYVDREMAADPERVAGIMSEFQWALNKVTLDELVPGNARPAAANGETTPGGGAACTS